MNNDKSANTNLEVKPSLNTAMLIMQCIGIIAVVCGHIDLGYTNLNVANLNHVGIPNILNVAFPYYSWHMPFFVFISGYFFNRTKPCGTYILQKVKTHLLPALLINFVCGIFALCIKNFNITKYGHDITLKSLFETPFTTGYQFHINVSMWFVFCLIIIEIIACIMDRLTRSKWDIPFLIITLGAALYCSYRTFYNHSETREEYLNAALRLGFLMFFFWLGICYRKYGERLFKRFLNFKTSIIIFAVQAAYLGITQYNIAANVRSMHLSAINIPNGFWVAIVSPITATLFLLGISYSLEPRLTGSKTLAAFGRGTKYIMYYHQLIFVLCTVLQGVLIKLSLVEINGFSFDKMVSNVYYTGSNLPISCIIAIIALVLPVSVCRFIDKQKLPIKIALYVGITAAIILFLYLSGRVLN